MMVLVAMLVLVQPGQGTVTCQQVVSSVAPCVPYLTSGTGSPTTTCCNGVSGLKQLTPTTKDRRATCQCLKDAVNHYQNIKEDVAAGACKVQINVPISMSVNCNDKNQGNYRYS